MREKSFKTIKIIFVISLILCAFLIIEAFFSSTPGFGRDNELSMVNFHGEYMTSEMDEPSPYVPNLKINANAAKYVVYEGHFDQNLEEGVSVMLRAYYISASIYVNGIAEVELGKPHTYPKYMHSAGSGWVTIKSPGIDADDTVRIVLARDYNNTRTYSYDSFITNIYKGSSAALLQLMVEREGFVIFTGAVMLLLGILFLIVLVLARILKLTSQRFIMWLAVLMVSGGLWMSVDYNIISLVINRVYVLNLLEFSSQNIMLLSAIFYIKHFLNGKAEVVEELCLGGQILFFASYVICQITGIADGYEMNNTYSMLAVAIITISLVNVYIQYRREPSKEILFMGISILMLFLGALIDISNYLLDYSRIFFGMQLGLGTFVLMHGYKAILTMRNSYEAQAKLSKLENQLMENSINVMVSQIQPHFMFNCLTAIQQLCIMDPDRAEEAVSDFASFLRVNIDTLRSTDLVPFSKELIHIKHYINLEKMRFDDRVNIEYDIKATDFMIPSLAIQPLVENAVRYGITKQMEGGTIKLSTYTEFGNIVIVVEDDGVGFDPGQVKNDGKNHLGIITVRERIEGQCNGALRVDSQKGIGTKITITIPFKEEI